jgi:hypothetical protein
MSKNVKIPKKIAGVKLPKQARKTANRALKMGASPMVREIAVAAIGAASARAAGELKEPRTEEHRFSGRAQIHIDGAKVGEAFRTAAIDGLRRFLEGFEEGLRNIGEPAAPDGGQPKPKAASAARPGAGRD